jgi:pentatricopeptide repeat protein
MQEDGIDPSVHTIVGLLKTCTKLRDIEKGWKLHLEVLQQGLDRHGSIGAALIDMYSKCGMLTEASEVFNELTCQDVLAWSTLIAGYVEHGPPNEVLNLFDRMRLVGVTASSSIFSGTFRACGALGTISKGHELHTESVMMGLDRDAFVGTSLVCMYAKCGFVEDSRDVFQRLPDRDVVSWNAQIAGYLDAGDGQEALNCFTAMKMQGMSPDSVTYSVSLKACGLLRSIARGREIHTEIMLAAIEKDLSISNSLIAMYAKCGFLSEAQHVARNMLVKDVSSWTSLIAGYADHGPAQAALDYIETMQLEGLSPDAVILACSLNACCLLGDLKEAQSKHADIVQRGFEEDSSVGSSLISMYAKLGAVAEAQNAFDKLRTRGVVEWTALTTGYAEYGLHKEAMTCLDLMEQDGIAPNSVTFICALTACGILDEAQRGQDIHTSIILRGLESGLQVGNSLIAMYGRCGLLVEAHAVFQKLPSKDAVSWNALISACVEQGLGRAALDVFDEMQMQGQAPDAVTFLNILKACGDLGALDVGREIHRKLKGCGYGSEPSLSNSAISMYAKCGSLTEAQEVFDTLQVRDVVAWSSIIKAYGVNHRGEKAARCFEDMERERVKPDAIAFACLLLACSHSRLVHEGIGYFKAMREKHGVVPEAEHYASIVDLLARSGRLYEAEQFVTAWCPASGAAWSALLSGCKTYGEVELGSRCFRQLVDTNPDVATWYVLMADLYAMAGRRDDAMLVEGLRKHVGAAKRRASASIEIDKQVHEFVVGSNEHGYEKIAALLNRVSSPLKERGHLPNLGLVLNPRADGAKDAALCEHAEKLALAFGLLCTSPGATLRVSKNLRMCDDCHNTSKILSRVERREIVLRDDCCIHHFKNGLCSCGDTF